MAINHQAYLRPEEAAILNKTSFVYTPDDVKALKTKVEAAIKEVLPFN
jgi:hypothetical protein